MKPTEVFDYGRTVYEYIQANPLVTRGGLNSHYRTSSDDRRNRNLTWVLEALLARGYIFKHTDPETAQVYFWIENYTQSPYQADPLPELNYTPVDVFGKRPVVAAPPPPVPDEPMGDPVELPPCAAPAPDMSQVTQDIEKVRDRLKGALRDIYVVMSANPCKLYSKNDEMIAQLGYSMPDRARFLGRMFGLGVIRRFKDLTDKSVSYYTLFGECPESLVEDLSSAKPLAKTVKQKAEVPVTHTHKGPAEDYKYAVTHGTEDLLKDEEDDEEDLSVEDDDTAQPLAFISNAGSVLMVRTDGTTDQFDLEESMALVELFLMTNHEVLSQRLAKLKAAQ